MEFITGLLTLVVFGCIWGFIVRAMRAKGRGLVVRHLVGFIGGWFGAGIVGMMMAEGGLFVSIIGFILAALIILARVGAYANDNTEVKEKGPAKPVESVTEPAAQPAAKPSNELIVLAKFILADDKVEQKEAEQLLELLNCTPPYLMDPVTRTLFQAVDHAMSDGVLDAVEADEIRVLLGEVCDLDLERKVMPKPAKPKVQAKAVKKTKEKAFKPQPKSKVATSIRSGDVFEIVYFDANFNPSTRKVDFKSARSSNGNTYMNAWCHERAALRTFRGDRVHSMVNIKTGEVVENIEQSLMAFNRH